MSGEEDLSAPEKLRPDHDLSSFDSGTPVLDDWLRRRALPNQESGASRTYVVCAGRRVVGYYALAAGAVAQSEATGRTRRNMPDPVPVMVIGRLAIVRAGATPQDIERQVIFGPETRSQVGHRNLGLPPKVTGLTIPKLIKLTKENA